MGAENVNRRTQAETPGCSSSLKEISVLTILSLEMRRGFPTQTSSQSDSKCNGATHRPKAKKFKQASSVRKIMATVFWDRKRILLTDFLECGLTINADAYCEPVGKLRRAIQNKRSGMLSSWILLLHDNARPHTAARTAQLLQQFRWEVYDHPPYSPHLAPSDYHLFMHLKKWLDPKALKTTIDRKQALPHGSIRWRRASLTLE